MACRQTRLLASHHSPSRAKTATATGIGGHHRGALRGWGAIPHGHVKREQQRSIPFPQLAGRQPVRWGLSLGKTPGKPRWTWGEAGHSRIDQQC